MQSWSLPWSTLDLFYAEWGDARPKRWAARGSRLNAQAAVIFRPVETTPRSRQEACAVWWGSMRRSYEVAGDALSLKHDLAPAKNLPCLSAMGWPRCR